MAASSPLPILVRKYGGSSLATVDRIRAVAADLAAKHAEGRPLGGVEIEVVAGNAGDHAEPVRSDADGRFLVSQLQPDATILLEAHHPVSLVPTRLEVKTGVYDLQGLEISLPRGCRLAGRLLDARGKPAADRDLVVTIRGTSSVVRRLRARTDAVGSFRFERLPAGLVDVELEIHGPDGDRLPEGLNIPPLRDGEDRVLVLQLEPTSPPTQH